MKRWCVYVHTVPSHKVYVGITSQNPIKRWNNGLGYNRQIYFYRAILKYGWDNIKHEIIVSGISGEEAKCLERYYIEKYQANNPNFGYNLTKGGEGTLGFHHSQESRNSMSIKHSGRKIPRDVVERIASKNRGKKITEEAKKKMSEAKLNQSFETKQKISNTKKGKSHSKVHCLNISKALKGRNNIWNNKAVLQCSKQGVFIKEWNIISEASRVLNISQGNIVACCKGRLKSAGGFIWKYKLKKKNMLVIKRSGDKEEFNVNKILNAVNKAFISVNEIMPEYLNKMIPALFSGFDIIGVEDIQDKTEQLLMNDKHFKAAKSYILYREKHREAREIRERIDYMENYSKSSENAATSSETDANANVSMKNVVTLEAEVPKVKNRIIQRQRIKNKLNELYPEVAEQYEKDLNHHIIYTHDEASSCVPKNYCEAVTLYPLLYRGIKGMDGITPSIPKHLSSFCGQFNNLVFLLSAQCKGAVAFGEFFNFFDYFCVKDFGEDYINKENLYADSEYLIQRKTIGQKIEDAFQTIVYYINQPAQNRGWQSPFTNISYYDKYYWEALFKDFYFPDGTQPKWERVSYLQKKFMKWFNKERTKAMLTFFVETMALLVDDKGNYLDAEYKDFTAEMHSKGHSFFVYVSDNPNSLSSCCRLKNEIDGNEFSFTNGLTGVKTGSCNVITLNINRIVQDCDKAYGLKRNGGWKENTSFIKDYLVDILERVYKYHIAYKTILYEWEERGMFNACTEGYISMRDLFCTIGVNGINEAARFLGLEISYNESYKNFCRLITGTISEQNKKHTTKKFKFNQEFVPKCGGHIKPLLIDSKLPR